MNRYLVIGSPVAHSLSPAMMAAAFGSIGRPDTYEAREIRPEDWPGALRALHREGIAGVNVTVPHKEKARADAWEVTQVAREIGAANTLQRLPHGWLADNTDGPGFLDWVSDTGVGVYTTREALVLGAGGSARAVVWALLRAGCPHVRIANRTAERAHELAASLRENGLGERTDRITVESPGERAPEGGLVINCTSVGLRMDDPSPIEPNAVAPAAAYLDLVYGAPSGVATARQAGVRTEDGLGLLVAQGALAFERWTGVRPDRRVLFAAAEAERVRRKAGAN